jgi:transaldolase
MSLETRENMQTTQASPAPTGVRASDLSVKIFADGADVAQIAELAAHPLIAGFTTNPTLMGKAGVTDYEAFAKQALEIVGDRPISFEVFADDFGEMGREARVISSWAENVYTKIPVTDTSGNPATELIRQLASEGVNLNVTGLLTLGQVEAVAAALEGEVPACVSLFAGRIADAGVDPVPMVVEAVSILEPLPQAELIWASPREVLNIVQADSAGCDIITVTHDLLAKLPLLGKDLAEFSLETVRMFHRDAVDAGFRLDG